MAGFRNIDGSGYGNAYVDALIAGGAVWDTSTEALTIGFGNPANRSGWLDIHGAPKAGSNGLPYLIPGTFPPNSWNASSWSGNDFKPIINAIDELRRITNINLSPTYEEWGQGPRTDNLILWKTILPREAGNQVWASADTPQEVFDRNRAIDQSWLYLHTGEGAWRYPHKGGMGFAMVLNMFGSALGLEQAYLGLPDVTSAYDPGPLGLNQAPFTVMSANWSHQGTGEPTGEWGSMKTFGAFDIAALQKIYGANAAFASGNDVYTLPTINLYNGQWGGDSANGWTCIWDTGGVDTISGEDAKVGVKIDLRAATLANGDPNAGGYLSQSSGIAGGFTIANGVVIENAKGSAGNDTLIGNSAANRLEGGAGDDTYHIDSPNDVVVDTSGNDTVYATFNFAGAGIENVYVNGVKVVSGGTPTGNGFNPIKGTGGKNNLVGKDGNDKFYGGLGNDTLTGKGGIDIFVFNTKLNKTTNKDKITDFSVRDDVIWLDNKIFKKLGSRGSENNPSKLKASFFTTGDKAKDRDDYIVYNKKKGVLSYDADGSGTGQAIEFATVKKNLALRYDDFFVI